MTEITSVISWVKYISDLTNSVIQAAVEMVPTDNYIITTLFLKSLILFLNMAQRLCHTTWIVSVSKCENEIIHCPDTLTQWLQPNISLPVSLSCHCHPHSGTWKKLRLNSHRGDQSSSQGNSMSWWHGGGVLLQGTQQNVDLKMLNCKALCILYIPMRAMQPVCQSKYWMELLICCWRTTAAVWEQRASIRSWMHHYMCMTHSNHLHLFFPPEFFTQFKVEVCSKQRADENREPLLFVSL